MAAAAWYRSRNGHTFKQFAELCTSIAKSVRVESAVIDGEIVCLDNAGRSVFNDPMFRRGAECYFYAFDLLFADDEDLRALPSSSENADSENSSQSPLAPILPRPHRGPGLRPVRICLQDGFRRDCRQAEAFTVSSYGEAITPLDQNQKPDVLADRGASGDVRGATLTCTHVGSALDVSPYFREGVLRPSD
jgi:hypothetical protein